MALLFPLILRRRNLGTTSNKSKKMSSPPNGCFHRTRTPSEYIHRVNKRDGTIFFSFLINIANPGGSIRDGKLVTNKVDFQRIASKINAHLLTFLEGTGYSYQNITVYMDEKGIYYLRLEGLRYVVPNMNGGKLVI